MEPDEHDGSYFIDRAGTCAPAVLRYLRGQRVYEYGERAKADLLRSDAEYYRLPGLLEALERAVPEPEAEPEPEQALPLLTAEQTEQVRQWCGGDWVRFEVLWRSSVHGDSAKE